jgi:hypothetical protein
MIQQFVSTWMKRLGRGGAVETLQELKAAGTIQAIGLRVRNHRFCVRRLRMGDSM